MLSDSTSLTTLSGLIDSSTPPLEVDLPDLYRSIDVETVRSPGRRSDKIKQLTGDDDAQAFHNARLAQASLPWFLRPSYTNDEIKMEYDGSVRAGTLSALVERLTVDPLSVYRLHSIFVYRADCPARSCTREYISTCLPNYISNLHHRRRSFLHAYSAISNDCTGSIDSGGVR
jgi:hypothetical protein